MALGQVVFKASSFVIRLPIWVCHKITTLFVEVHPKTYEGSSKAAKGGEGSVLEKEKAPTTPDPTAGDDTCTSSPSHRKEDSVKAAGLDLAKELSNATTRDLENTKLPNRPADIKKPNKKRPRV